MRGEPDFDTPAHIRQAAVAALQAGETHYPPVQGLPALRQAIAGRMARDFGLTVDPDEEVLVTTGATMGMYVAVQAVVNLGDEVIIFDPVYDPYPTVIRVTGGVPVRVPTEAHNGHFSASPEAIAAALTGRSKAIILNTPWNPTGTVMTLDDLRALVDLAEAHNLVLIVDEIYEAITFDGHVHHHLAALSPQARARTITVNSFSKTYAMTGWRLGYNIAPPALTRAMLRIAEQFSRSAATFIQHAGAAALNGPQDAVEQMRATYAQRRKFIAASLTQAGLATFNPPEGTFFTLVDIRPFGLDSQSMADYLLEEARLVTIPASVYGPAGEGYIRLSFAYHEDALSQGMEALGEALKRLS
jgi:aspartate/methionine/tyrosine aminotransferase